MHGVGKSSLEMPFRSCFASRFSISARRLVAALANPAVDPARNNRREIILDPFMNLFPRMHPYAGIHTLDQLPIAHHKHSIHQHLLNPLGILARLLEGPL